MNYNSSAFFNLSYATKFELQGSSSTLSYLLLWWLLTVRDVAVYGCQTSPHLRLASRLSHHHQVSCGGLWASQDFPLPTGVRLLCQAATLLDPALPRGLCIVFILVEPFCAPFPSGVARFEEVLAPGGLQLQCYNLGYLDTKPASSRRSSSRSCGGLWASSLKVVKGHHHHQVVLFLASSS